MHTYINTKSHKHIKIHMSLFMVVCLPYSQMSEQAGEACQEQTHTAYFAKRTIKFGNTDARSHMLFSMVERMKKR